MVKVVVVKKADALALRDAKSGEFKSERTAIRRVTSAKESRAYKETVAVKVPVTYVSKGAIIREAGGHFEVIGHTAPSVKITSSK